MLQYMHLRILMPSRIKFRTGPVLDEADYGMYLLILKRLMKMELQC